MRTRVTRRDFLKLSGLLPLSLAAPRSVQSLNNKQEQQNVLVIVFDTLSAKNISLYGYPRETMPNLSRLADRAIVYHNHHAGGSFTTPGTASLLTGTLPWTHRAFQDKGSVSTEFIDKNIFVAFQNYYRIIYSHNPWAILLLDQFKKHYDDYIPLERFLLTNDGFIPLFFGEDKDIATVSWIRSVKSKSEGFAYSLFISRIYEMFRNFQTLSLQAQYPRGIPSVNVDNYYLLGDAIDGTANILETSPQPFMGYFHFMPPHQPYRSHQDFYDHFKNDGLSPIHKPIDLFSPETSRSYPKLEKYRRAYDEFILNVDMEFKRLFDKLEESGLLDNTWIVLTSDHGEMFERGIHGHMTPVLYEPIIRIPLIIFEPGREKRKDIFTSTSAVDVLPTLLHITGQRVAFEFEGRLLPPYGEEQQENRSIYVVDAKKNDKYAPLTIASTAMMKGDYKLIDIFGHRKLGGSERIELYDIRNDPEELNNLYLSKQETASEMLNELKGKLAEVNEPYNKNDG